MNAALHVGRVGALAIALGFGAAVCPGSAGVATADTADAPNPATASDSAPNRAHPPPTRRAAGPRRTAAPEPAPASPDFDPPAPAATPVAQTVSAPAAHSVRFSPQPAAVGMLGALFGSTPGGTPESPVGWVMLAAARRQFGSALSSTALPAVAATALINRPP